MPGLIHRAALASVVGGLVGGLLGAGVMSAAHALMTARAGDPSTPPANDVKQEDDATVKIADQASRIVRGRPLTDEEKPLAGHLVHYGFGTVMGGLYGVAALVSPIVTAGAGTAYGAAVWLGAHAIMVPALGLAPSPLRQPVSKEARELILHLAFGVTVAVVRKAALSLSGARASGLRTSR